MNKQCSHCPEVKPLHEFGNKKDTKDGLMNHCRACEKIKSRDKYLKNRKVILAKQKAKLSDLDFVAKRKDYDQKYASNNKAKRKQQTKTWAENNRERKRALNSARKKRVQQATLKGFYKQLVKIHENRPDGCHVDHIVPLNNPNVCGLNVPWNLQYLTVEDNLRKSNKYE